MNTQINRKARRQLLYMITSFMLLFQYQNCAQPISRSFAVSDPSYSAQPLAGGNVSGGTVSAINGNYQAKMLFAVSSVELSIDSTELRPGGVCSLPANAAQVQWQLTEDAVNSLVVNQGSENCTQGSFYVDLSSSISNLECEKSYLLSASLPGETPAQMSIIKHCPAVASN